MKITDNSLRESFQLLVLRALAERWNGRFWAVKGGCAMRFFHHSDRCSVDLDADAPGFSVASLKSGAAAAVEEAGRMIRERGWGDVENPSFPKAGENVVRVKISLLTAAGGRLPTKIELSRGQAALKSFRIAAKPGIDCLQNLGMAAFLVPVYSREAMLALKIAALIGRTEFAVRDVFDLGHLLPAKPSLRELRAAKIGRAELLRGSILVLGADAAWKRYESDVQPYLAGGRFDEMSWDGLRRRLSDSLAAWADLFDEA